jgi:ABC-type multidrug transport system fused ATPase/permease subunit
MFRRERLSVWISGAMRITLAAAVSWVLWVSARGASLTSGQRALLAGSALALIQAAQMLPEFAKTLVSMVNKRASTAIRLRRADALLGVSDELLGEYEESERVSVGLFRHIDPPIRPAPTLRPVGNRTLRSVQLVGFPIEPIPGLVLAEPLDLEVRRGEFVVLSGPVGVGKSFVLEALAGLRADAGPYLRWNGVAIEDPLNWLRPPLVAFVPQAPSLVSASLAANVSLDYDRNVEAALELAQFDVAVEVDDGLETVIGHRGLRLSGGQAQRVAAARAFAVNAELTVVDDLSSALDGATEIRLWQALRADGRTVVASSHSPVAHALADRVIELVPASMGDSSARSANSRAAVRT